MLRCIGELLLNLVSLAGIVSVIYDMLWLSPLSPVYNIVLAGRPQLF